MVMSQVKSSTFHSLMILYHGKKPQIEKVVEELLELKEALKGFDRDHIIEELGDVEIVLPYLKKIFIPAINLKIEPYPEFVYKYDDICDLVVALIRMRQEYGDTKIVSNMLRESVTILCHALGDIYYIHKILPDEVELWKEEKYRRCLKDIAKKIVG